MARLLLLIEEHELLKKSIAFFKGFLLGFELFELPGGLCKLNAEFL